ncbi:MAG: integration host factor subunit alpha [Alphaproteobacteria bacterium]|nr:integration host factor subunit alpha [Alphaproteobacteria bacterium]
MSESITRADLAEAVYRDLGLSYAESSRLVDFVFEQIIQAFEAGEDVKISSFASFLLRHKREREGRNPKTGEAFPICSRTGLSFVPSQALKTAVEKGIKEVR